MSESLIADTASVPLVFLVAGEPSGDLLGARLMAALKAETAGRVRFAGVGGENMAAEGLDSLFPLEDVAVMGIFEILPHVLRIYRRIKQTVAAARAAEPAVVVTIDSPSFTLEIAQRLGGTGVPRVHLVAPQVWAWKPWRARHMAAYVDHLLALLPFEPPYFERHGLATTFVGHPAVEATAQASDPAAFRARHGIPRDAPLLCLLPGSRRGEVKRLLPVFGQALALLKDRVADLRVVTPTVASVADEVTRAAAAWPVPAVVLRDHEEKYRAFAACDAALAASGTVSLELAVARVPAVIAYRVAASSALLARMLVRVRHVALVNIIAGRQVQPELLQHDCTPEKLARAVERLLSDPLARSRQVAGYEEVGRQIGTAIAPSTLAARTVLEIMSRDPVDAERRPTRPGARAHGAA